MSRKQFQDAAGDLGAYNIKNKIKYTYRDLEAAIRDKWLKEERYNELINWAHDEYDGADIYGAIEVIEKHFVKNRLTPFYKRFMTVYIRRNLDLFWWANLRYGQIDKFKVKSYSGIHIEIRDYTKETIEQQSKTINLLERYKNGLATLGEVIEIKKIDELIESVKKREKIKESKPKIRAKIDEVKFWQIIEEAKKGANGKYEFNYQLNNILGCYSSNQSKSFQRILLKRLTELDHWEVWDLAYIIRGGCGDDQFIDFKLWVISQGEKFYKQIVALDFSNISSNDIDEDPLNEELMYIAPNIYSEKSGNFLDIKIKQPKIKGKQIPTSKFLGKYPRLCKEFKFNE